MAKRHDEPLNIRSFIHDARLIDAEAHFPGECRLSVTSDFISAHHGLDVATVYTITIEETYASEIKAYRYQYIPRLVSAEGEEKVYETEYSEFEEYQSPAQF